MTQLFENPAIIAGVGIILGLFVGWAVWRGPGLQRKRLSADEESVATIEAELAKARELLAADAESDSELADEIENIDQAVKRANGRLKLLLKSVDQATENPSPKS